LRGSYPCFSPDASRKRCTYEQALSWMRWGKLYGRDSFSYSRSLAQSANREINSRCRGSDHQQSSSHQRNEPQETRRHHQSIDPSSTQIAAPIYPHEKRNGVIAFAISYRTIPAIEFRLLHEPDRRVTIYLANTGPPSTSRCGNQLRISKSTLILLA
jgi:hypothetical protein